MYKKKYSFLLPVLFSLILFNNSCNNGTNTSGEVSPLKTKSETSTEKTLRQSQNYLVTLVSNWNKEDHLKLPGGAHFSKPAVVHHKSDYTLIPFGGQATPGLEELAELGQTGEIEEEFEQKMRTGFIISYSIFPAMHLSDRTSMQFTISVTASAPYFSMASMIAPSPDWIIGIDSLPLYDKEKGFSSGVERQALYAISAGTEGKDTAGNFTLSDNAPDPVKHVKSLKEVSGFEEPFAYITIEKKP